MIKICSNRIGKTYRMLAAEMGVDYEDLLLLISMLHDFPKPKEGYKVPELYRNIKDHENEQT